MPPRLARSVERSTVPPLPSILGLSRVFSCRTIRLSNSACDPSGSLANTGLSGSNLDGTASETPSGPL